MLEIQKKNIMIFGSVVWIHTPKRIEVLDDNKSLQKKTIKRFLQAKEV